MVLPVSTARWQRQGSIGEVTWDRHYHVTLYSDLHLRRLLRELKLEEAVCWRRVSTGFFASGRLYPFSTGWDFLRLPPLDMLSKLRLGWTIWSLAALANGASLEGSLLEPWLRRSSGNQSWERFWRPLLRAKLGDNYRQTSAAFIWATVCRLYAARRSGLGRERFGYVRGGTALSSNDCRTNSNDAAWSFALARRSVGCTRKGRLEVDTAGERLRFDRVVWTVPSDTVAPCLSAAVGR